MDSGARADRKSRWTRAGNMTYWGAGILLIGLMMTAAGWTIGPVVAAVSAMVLLAGLIGLATRRDK